MIRECPQPDPSFLDGVVVEVRALCDVATIGAAQGDGIALGRPLRPALRDLPWRESRRRPRRATTRPRRPAPRPAA